MNTIWNAIAVARHRTQRPRAVAEFRWRTGSSPLPLLMSQAKSNACVRPGSGASRYCCSGATPATPTTSNSRRTSLGLTTTDAVALRSPLIAVTT